MHELSVVASLFEILEEHLKEQKAKKIILIKVQVGDLSGVVPELLETAFDIYKKGTFAEESKMEINKKPLKIRCKKCRTEFVKSDFIFICEKCGSTDIETLEGTELLLEKIEFEV